MYRILCVEDSAEVQIVLKRTLGSSHEIVLASTLQEARLALEKTNFDMVVLDINLPDGDGLRFCSELKASNELKDIPVMILTSNHTINDKTLGFQLGIEDFLEKPFDPIELRLRIESRLKKIFDQKNAESIMVIGNLKINHSSQRVEVDFESTVQAVELSSTEFRILNYLARNVDHVKSREQIINEVWGNSVHLLDRTIDSHLSRIRKKIIKSNCTIEAIPSVGYRFSLKKNEEKAA